MSFKRMPEPSIFPQEILTDYQTHWLSQIFLSQEDLKYKDDIKGEKKKKKKLSFNATLTFKHFPEGQLEETAVLKLTSMNFIFQMCRLRCQNTGFPVTSAVCRQQALKLEALKRCTGCKAPAFPTLPKQTIYFYHFQMVLPWLCKHREENSPEMMLKIRSLDFPQTFSTS